MTEHKQTILLETKLSDNVPGKFLWKQNFLATFPGRPQRSPTSPERPVKVPAQRFFKSFWGRRENSTHCRPQDVFTQRLQNDNKTFQGRCRDVILLTGHVGEDQITPVTSVRNLGVIFDSNLKMDMQITKACQIAYYHLHNIRRIRKFLSQEATCTIIHAFITSQIDYCNSLMNGLPENLIKKLQRVQNTAARLVFNLRKYDRITPALVTLHWLPVKYRIEFKTLLIVFKGLHGKAPTYIQEMITPSKSKRYSIRSNEERVLKVPKFKHDTFGKRAFAVYGPLAWNCLPKEIRLCDEIEAFKRNLKTHLFVKFVNESTLAIWFWRIIVKRPRMLSAQFVALYKPCKPKPKPKPEISNFSGWRLSYLLWNCPRVNVTGPYWW